MAPDIPAINPSPNKKARLNPARRKAAKAKRSGQNAQDDSPSAKDSDVCISSQGSASNVGKKHAPSQASLGQAPSPQQKSVRTIAASKTLLGTARPASTQPNHSNSHRPETCNEPMIASLDTPAFVTSGLVGCMAGAAVLLGSGLWSQLAGVDAAILAARTSKMVTNNIVDEGITSLKAGTYNAPEALDMVRRTTLAYAGAIPGGVPFVERLFREVDVVRRKRGGDVDRALAETRGKLASARKRGASAAEMHVVVLRQMAKLSAFTSDATQDIVARNPRLKQYLSVLAK